MSNGVESFSQNQNDKKVIVVTIFGLKKGSLVFHYFSFTENAPIQKGLDTLELPIVAIDKTNYSTGGITGILSKLFDNTLMINAGDMRTARYYSGRIWEYREKLVNSESIYTDEERKSLGTTKIYSFEPNNLPSNHLNKEKPSEYIQSSKQEVQLKLSPIIKGKKNSLWNRSPSRGIQIIMAILAIISMVLTYLMYKGVI